MQTDAGWRKEDGLCDDMWRTMAERPGRITHPDEDTLASSCPYGLLISIYKEGREWDAQEIEVYLCHLGSQTGRRCTSKSEKCYESFVQSVQPNSRAAKDARTGGLSTG